MEKIKEYSNEFLKKNINYLAKKNKITKKDLEEKLGVGA